LQNALIILRDGKIQALYNN